MLIFLSTVFRFLFSVTSMHMSVAFKDSTAEYNAGTFATDRSKDLLDHSYCSSLNIAGSFVGLLCLARLNITPWGSSSFVFGYIGTWSFVESLIIMDTGTGLCGGSL